MTKTKSAPLCSQMTSHKISFPLFSHGQNKTSSPLFSQSGNKVWSLIKTTFVLRPHFCVVSVHSSPDTSPVLTFSWHIAHYGTTRNVSLPTALATGGWWALHHSWTRRTPVCSTNANNSTAGLLIVKWIQLLLVFSWRFQPPQRVINLDLAF